jgi:broad specificity phosphatase PhoE
MKLILVRHEERSDDIGFFEHLTDKGLYNAKNIISNKINKISTKVDYIFSSPYCRTIETIQFYAESKNKKINIENSLCEFVNNTYFIYNKCKYNWNKINNPKYHYLKKIFNNDYRSLIDINKINSDIKNILESELEFKNRIINFINYLKKNYENNSVVVLSTHLHVINMFIYLYKNIKDPSESGACKIHSINVEDYGEVIELEI